MPKWIKDVKDSAPENVLICLCGNKIDLKDKRRISDKEGREFGEKFFTDLHYSVSAKTDEGLSEMFQGLAQIIEQRFGPELRKKM